MILYLVWGVICLITVLFFHMYLMVQDPNMVEEVDEERREAFPEQQPVAIRNLVVMIIFLISVVIWPIVVGWLISMLFKGETLAHYFYRSFRKQNGKDE